MRTITRSLDPGTFSGDEGNRFRFVMLIVTVAGIFLLGALAGAWRAAKTRERILDELLDNARRCAIAFDPTELQRLTGTAADAGTVTYRSVKDRLTRFQAPAGPLPGR